MMDGDEMLTENDREICKEISTRLKDVFTETSELPEGTDVRPDQQLRNIK